MSDNFYLNPDKPPLDSNVTYERLSAFYDDIELAIIFDWLQLPRPAEICSADATRDRVAIKDSGGRLRLLDGDAQEDNGLAVSNAVARLLLSNVQEYLPQWSCFGGKDAVFGREYAPRRASSVEVLSRFQFEINWADSGPGFSWPESYYSTLLPIFNLYIVTASQDSPDTHGYTDEAIGCFRSDVPHEQGVHDIVVGWWRREARGSDQYRWQNLFYTGAIDESTAESWADEVWECDSGEPLAA